MTTYNGFWMALANRDGSRLIGSERQFVPHPSAVRYPGEFMGTVIETADGVAIKQQPSGDPRRRTWAWEKHRAWFPQYEELWQQLAGLKATDRWRAGLSPFVYLKDTLTNKMVITSRVIGMATGGTATELTANGLVVGQYDRGSIEIIAGTGVGQQRFIQSTTATAIVPSQPWVTIPDATSQFLVRHETPDWIRCRVLDVDRDVDSQGGDVRYAETRLVFVIDDVNYHN